MTSLPSMECKARQDLTPASLASQPLSPPFLYLPGTPLLDILSKMPSGWFSHHALLSLQVNCANWKFPCSRLSFSNDHVCFWVQARHYPAFPAPRPHVSGQPVAHPCTPQVPSMHLQAGSHRPPYSRSFLCLSLCRRPLRAGTLSRRLWCPSCEHHA